MNGITRDPVHIRGKTSATVTRCGQSSEEAILLTVSRTKPANAIKEVIAVGQRVFDENCVQGGVDEIRYFQERGANDLQRHSIGPLRSNKDRPVAEHFDWCHTVDRLHIAARLSEQCPAELPPLNVLTQINISDENSESGVSLAELDAPAAEVAALPYITLCDLMAIPAPESGYVRQFEVTQQMAVVLARLKAHYPSIDTLSLGVSDDMGAVIAAGSTTMRIGTTISGARDHTRR